MFRVDGDHVNWVLVVILVIATLLLAMVSSTGYGFELKSDRFSSRADNSVVVPQVIEPTQKVIRSSSEAWYVARELYYAGEPGKARLLFEKVVAELPTDPAARMWAGMAAFRAGDRPAALLHWQHLSRRDALVGSGVWPVIAMAAAELDLGRTDRAARYVVPVERGDYGLELACHPVVSFYAGRVYELLAMAAPKYREAVEESLAEKFSSAVASKDESQWASPNSRSWLIFLAKRAYSQAARSDWSLNHAMPIMPETATAEPSFVPTVGELLECLGSTDFAAQSRRKLRAIKLYQSEPELFHDRHWMKRGQFIA